MLTERQQLVLEACTKFIQEHLYSPSIWEIMEMTKINSTSCIRAYLDVLEFKGLIKRVPGQPRTIQVYSILEGIQSIAYELSKFVEEQRFCPICCERWWEHKETCSLNVWDPDD